MTILLDVLGPGPVVCTECGRTLRRADSIRRRQGDHCWGKTHPAVPRARMPRRRAVMAAPAPRTPAPADGQLALDIDTQQPPRKAAR